ncbi:DUF3551 domain-containing protein [Bradyrhizobium lablabi]|uniref:DUF3551 domain-containing protein n=1 Tax=Bradyrhizobium lablabi TaxID=722472 RepID=UPI001BACB532|nr:DUF3551 domain-containing protein [Bradyrhizobium lablabi]MBR0693064.1 DUF3551 domain-containing protein [Bradyrhizobium lablabi]
MHRLLMAALSVSVLVTIGAASPAAAARDRYCLQGHRWGFPGNCQFSTRRQCMASASGTRAHCGINPRYAPARRQ